MDDLAWDLGNPDDAVKTNPIPINLGDRDHRGVFVLPAPINGTGSVSDFHPMKGPMTTQTLRGMRRQRRHALARRPRQPAAATRRRRSTR